MSLTREPVRSASTEQLSGARPLPPASTPDTPHTGAPVPPPALVDEKSRNFTREDEEELIAFWNENHVLYSGKYKRRFLERAALRLNKKYQGEKKLFTAAKIRKKCDYMKRRFKEVRDRMISSGFGVEELTSKPDLRATVLAKFPLYEAMEPLC